MGYQRPTGRITARRRSARCSRCSPRRNARHRRSPAAGERRGRARAHQRLHQGLDIRRLAEAAGFRFVAASEVNANPRDTADWPNGVWTLPPALRLGEVDRERYLAIGESDRMTLRFVKPE